MSSSFTGSPSELTTHRADLSLSKPPKWAWQDRIVLGALSLIVGNEGSGKGTLAAWAFARLTLGELPGNLYGKPTTVGVIGDEDSWQDVWTPRLHAAGADLERMKLIERQDGEPIDLSACKSRLAALVVDDDMRLVYCDALLDNLGADTDDWRAKQVRGALAPARQLARELQCAVLGSLHPNKSTGGGFRRLVSGSVAFNAVSRSSLLLAEHPDDDTRRVLVRGKGNLSALPQAVEFSIESYRFEANGHEFNVPRASDFTTSALTTDELLATPATPAPAGEARTAARDHCRSTRGRRLARSRADPRRVCGTRSPRARSTTSGPRHRHRTAASRLPSGRLVATHTVRTHSTDTPTACPQWPHCPHSGNGCKR